MDGLEESCNGRDFEGRACPDGSTGDTDMERVAPGRARSHMRTVLHVRCWRPCDNILRGPECAGAVRGS